ncbi:MULTISPECIES: hypothetical protein [Tenacibaculum]|jgi:primase-polymerase (primpol)-like protein|uniref:Uncharacterized protein n=3 Tax=Tenacibaculum TaxID=104267 RepID=A0A3S8RAK8_9FLAO|nr:MULTISPECIES: hypothetical protein [Tenacibaculum]MEE3999695.1 hypothetical protein [Tenacibaculum sp. FZY0031]GFD74022.1 hypothetical protein KUL113_34420 [Tenacibaculum sp. KUL113]GFD80825.1 hypothetical protein KUL118_36870 [Tenacibaculum sp. KUL118]GFD92072.1 hypothetical protein KUL154_08050 [Alteromonas sp. KUL154]GFE01665.1 hypothetical protein KUL156_42570 [Alteromonas sp. KUL156]
MTDQEQKRLDTMNSVLVKMEDIKNTQKSLIEKIGVVEVQLFDIQSKDLDKELEKVMVRASDTLNIIKQATEAFEMKRNRLENEA